VIGSRSAETTVSTDVEREGFVHSALFYHSQQEYLDFVSRFVLDGLDNDEPVLVAVPGDELALLRKEIWRERAGTTAELHMVDITDVARNPSRFVVMAGDFVARHADRRVRVVSQLVWPGRTAAEALACLEHEALVNGDFQGRNVMGLCLYDAGRLDEDVLQGARATHPLLWKCGTAYRSADYAPDHALDRCNRPLSTNPGAVTYMVRESADLRPARSFALSYGDWVGLSQDGIEELQLIATELASNSLQYTNGACQLAFWRHNDHLVCEARDSGWFDDPLIGRRAPDDSGTASRGLFLVNAMADLVRTHTTTTGTTIQAYLRVEPSRVSTG
jgi:anti-sigma regulatory factor (Ser/Thr protein kinase)